jgi:predicted PurR-regulated permease PerM
MNSSGQAFPRGVAVLIAVVVVVAALRFAQEVFIPLALAILLTFLLAPIVGKLQRLGVNRAVAVVITVTVALLLFGALAWVVFDQFTNLVQELPRYRRQLRSNLLELTTALRGGASGTTEAIEQLTRELERVAPASPDQSGVRKVQIVEAPATPMRALSQFISPLIGPLATTAVVLVFVIFMLLRLPDLRDRLIRLAGSQNLRIATEALEDAARRVSRYLVMQTLINTWQGIWVAIGLTLIGLPNAGLWGALTVVIRFIPYIGPWAAATMPIALSFAVFDNWTQPMLVIGLFIVLELISNVVLEPLLYGSRTGVSPVALLVAATFWTWLWGIAGLFLAVPLTVCLVVLGKYIPQLSFLYVMLGDQPVLAPHERLYQRLLAVSRDDADELLEEELREQSAVEVCDRMVLPAMQLAEDDRDRGTLRGTARMNVFRHLEQWAAEFGDFFGAQETGHASPVAAAQGARVLCMPAADQADDIAARLLAGLLQEHGIEARAQRTPENGEPPDAVIISAMPPDAVTDARLQCKRARRRWPDVPIIVGLWNVAGDLQRPRQRLESAGARATVTTFAECMRELDAQLGGEAPAPAEPEPAPEALPASPHEPASA